MTRFLLPLSHAAELIFKALENPPDGLVFVRKSPSATLGDIAKVFSDQIKVVGERPGEKLHELLVSEDEMIRTREEDNYFIIGRHPTGQKRWEYTSGNSSLLRGKELKEFIDRSVAEVQV
jgi:UDP-glucose 4-epimerase